ncbi:MAG: hypothetical protein AAFX81_09685 [Pseudomonadota bacterium]
MSEPNPNNPSLGERLNQVIGWVQRRTRDEWIMFGIGVVVGLVIA